MLAGEMNLKFKSLESRFRIAEIQIQLACSGEIVILRYIFVRPAYILFVESSAGPQLHRSEIYYRRPVARPPPGLLPPGRPP